MLDISKQNLGCRAFPIKKQGYQVSGRFPRIYVSSNLCFISQDFIHANQWVGEGLDPSKP